MAHTYNFQTPRNLYEKLCRDSIKLDVIIDGDYMFNFISTAEILNIWIKKSALSSSTTVKRFLKRLKEDKNLNLCKKIIKGDSSFIIDPNSKGCQLIVNEVCLNSLDFKNEIMELYEIYFKIKGH